MVFSKPVARKVPNLRQVGVAVLVVVAVAVATTSTGGLGQAASAADLSNVPGAPVERTGQDECFNLQGSEIACEGTGQDGEYQEGVPWPTPRFVKGQDGTVVDRLTGLIWLADANCYGLANWLTAIQDVASLGAGTCGLSDSSIPGDWRLPNIRELQSLITFRYHTPPLSNSAGDGKWEEGDPFSGVASGRYWSSTSAGYYGYVQLIDPQEGRTEAGPQNDVFHVWAVRGATGGSPAPVDRTGQTTCYDSSGDPISCGGTGQDGEIQAGVPHPSPRFVDQGDGTVLDVLTGLTWLRNANCWGTRSWDIAVNDANTLASGMCGLGDGSVAGDWRLPNMKELESVLHFGYRYPALTNTNGDGQWTEGDPFVNVFSDVYYSSTTDADCRFCGWSINLSGGYGNNWNKLNPARVWPVKGSAVYPLFQDGFESGNTSAWSNTVP